MSPARENVTSDSPFLNLKLKSVLIYIFMQTKAVSCSSGLTFCLNLPSFWFLFTELYDERTLAGAFDSEPITDTSLDEVMFRAKYLGSTLVEKPSSEEATAEAIKTILSMAKAGGRKLQRVAVSLSLNGIKVVDIPTEEIHLDVSIYRYVFVGCN